MAFSTEVLRISCQCDGEEVAVGFDPEWPCLDLAFWLHGMPVGYGLRERVRAAWQVFRRGTPYTDMVILNSKEAAKLRDILIELVPKLQEAERTAKTE